MGQTRRSGMNNEQLTVIHMNNADKIFYSRFKKFVGLANDFSDPDDDSKTDREIARQIRLEAPASQRLNLLTELLDDSDRIVDSIDLNWEPLQRYVNRHFGDAATAKKWLLEIRNVWQEELTRLKGPL